MTQPDIFYSYVGIGATNNAEIILFCSSRHVLQKALASFLFSFLSAPICPANYLYSPHRLFTQLKFHENILSIFFIFKEPCIFLGFFFF